MLQLTGHHGAVYSLAFSADGQTLYSAGRDGTVRAWDLAAGRERLTLAGHAGPVLSLALHPAGKALASGGGDGIPRLWDLTTGALHEALPPQSAAVTGLGWLPNRNLLLVASGERLRPEKGGELKVFQWENRPPPALHRRDPNGLWSLAVAAGGPTIAWGGGARGVAAWDVTKPEPRALRQATTSLAVALSPDGKRLAAASDRAVRLFDVPRGRELATLEAHKGLVGALAFAPDGHILATGGRDQAVRFWSVGEGPPTARRTYEWPVGAVYAVTFSADGVLAAAAGDRGEIVVWDVD